MQLTHQNLLGDMMLNFDGILREALEAVIANLDTRPFETVTAETNIIDHVDSFTVVDLLLESEMALETATGNYITLADETIFDSEKSPLLSWANWVEFVERRHAV